MATQTVRAIYSAGEIRLLEPLSLHEGQELEVRTISERERVRAALGDLLVQRLPPADDLTPEEVARLRQEVLEASRGLPPASELIIAERQEGP